MLELLRGSPIGNWKWVSVRYFTEGWGFFFQQEIFVLAILFAAMGVIDQLIGNDYSVIVTHWMIIVFFRRIMAGGICTSTKRLDGQTIVITGCNVGIGKETARDLSSRGAKIIMACRDTKKAEKTAAEIQRGTSRELVVMKLDLASFSSIRTFAEDLKKREKKIHMLINNAGIMMCPYMKTEDGLEMQMGTNHFGHFLLTNLLLPLLTHSEPARIINLSSLAHLGGKIPFDDINYEKGYEKVPAYANSKIANILFTRQLAKKLKGTNVQVFSVHPGSVHTNLGRHVLGEIPRMMLGPFLMKTALEGAQTTLYCALEADQDDEYYYFSDCAVSYAVAGARDDAVAEKLWDFSEKVVGLCK